MTDLGNHVDAVARSGCPCRTGVGVRAAIRTDLERAVVLAEHHEGRSTFVSRVRARLFYPGVYGVAAYRVSHAALNAPVPAPLRQVVYILALLLQRLVITVTKVEISAQAHIGPGMFVNHAQGVVVGPVVAGSNLTISQFASLGLGGNAAQDALADDSQAPREASSPLGECPELGDRVWVGIGAVVSGRISIGDDVMIGANAVVSRDLAPRSVASGAPATVSSSRGSFAFVHYRGMLDDPTRAASLAQVPVVPEQRRSGGRSGREGDRSAPAAGR